MTARKLSQSEKKSRRGQFVTPRLRIRPRTAKLLNLVAEATGEFPGAILDDLVEYVYGHFEESVDVSSILAKSKVERNVQIGADKTGQKSVRKRQDSSLDLSLAIMGVKKGKKNSP